MNGRGKNKSRNKKREKRCKPRGVNSKGTHGQTKNPLCGVDRVLLGKGQHVTIRQIDCKPWRGVHMVTVPFDREQVEENKRLYPHLFDEDER